MKFLIIGYPCQSNFQMLIANILMILIIIVSLVVYEKVKKASRIDYSLLVLEMLKKAEQKYKFIDNQDSFCNFIFTGKHANIHCV